jgi:RNA polymerase sigma-70 factor (ECF subfamily)
MRDHGGGVAAEPRDVAPAVVERAKRGDRQAFAAVIRHYDPGLRALAFRITGDRDRMDDALQDAYLRAFRALPRFRGRSSLGTWLYRIVYNASIDELERSRRVVQLPLDTVEPADPAPEPDETVLRRRDLAEALSLLTPGDRAAVFMVDAHGYAYDDAAEVLGVPAGTIASRLNRARASLRAALASPSEGASEA